jgi:hypothetical protein
MVPHETPVAYPHVTRDASGISPRHTHHHHHPVQPVCVLSLISTVCRRSDSGNVPCLSMQRLVPSRPPSTQVLRGFLGPGVHHLPIPILPGYGASLPKWRRMEGSVFGRVTLITVIGSQHAVGAPAFMASSGKSRQALEPESGRDLQRINVDRDLYNVDVVVVVVAKPAFGVVLQNKVEFALTCRGFPLAASLRYGVTLPTFLNLQRWRASLSGGSRRQQHRKENSSHRSTATFYLGRKYPIFWCVYINGSHAELV